MRRTAMAPPPPTGSAAMHPLHHGLELERQVRDVLARAGGRPGHIFNLGHGVLPETPIEALQAGVEGGDGGGSGPGGGGAWGAARGGGAIAALLMACGAPEGLGAVEPYLLDVRGGRPDQPP